MLSRFVSASIVLFWMVMTFLLVRNEIAPDHSTVREVPLWHVLKLVYLHEQPSDLTILNGQATVGSIRLQPRIDRENNLRCLDISGDFRIELGVGQKSRFSGLGLFEMTPAFDLRHTKWNVAMTEPAHVRMEIERYADQPTTRFLVKSGEQTLAEGEVPEGESGLTSMARQFGMADAVNSIISQKNQQTPPTIRARQSTLTFRGERTDTYLITVEQNGQNLIEAHVSQLGQVLLAKTLIGYSMRLDSYGP